MCVFAFRFSGIPLYQMQAHKLEILDSNAALDRFQRAAERTLTEVIERLTSAEKTTGKAWLTNAEAMNFLDLSRPTLARYRADGRLPFSKIGSSIYYKLESIEALLESGMTNRRGAA